MGFVIRIHSNHNGLNNWGFSPKGPVTPKIRALYIGDYEYVNISSFAVLGVKLWLEENGDLKNDPLYSFKFIQSKAQY